MARVVAGTRLVLRTATGAVTMRALRDVPLDGRWSVPVLAPLRALQDGVGVVEIATDTGLYSASAHLRVADGVLELVPGASDVPALLQRRDDVRGRVSLPCARSPPTAPPSASWGRPSSRGSRLTSRRAG